MVSEEYSDETQSDTTSNGDCDALNLLVESTKVNS